NGGPTLTHALIAGSAAVDAGNLSEIQTIDVGGTLSGTFTITFRGQSTAPLPAMIEAGEFRDALNALSTIGQAGGYVLVTHTANQFTVRFLGALANNNMPQMVAAASGGLTVSIGTKMEGSFLPTTDQRGSGFARVIGDKVDIGDNVDIGAYELPRPLF